MGPARDHDLTASGSSAGDVPAHHAPDAAEYRCTTCGEEIRLAWIGYPPEPYGEVCGCDDPDFDDARNEVRDDRRDLAIEAELQSAVGLSEQP